MPPVFTLPMLGRTRSGNGLPVAVAAARTHWHRFRWAGDDAFSGSSLYACRCGVVRPAP